MECGRSPLEVTAFQVSMQWLDLVVSLLLVSFGVLSGKLAPQPT